MSYRTFCLHASWRHTRALVATGLWQCLWEAKHPTGRSWEERSVCAILPNTLQPALRRSAHAFNNLPCMKGLQPTQPDNHNRRPSLPLLHTRSPVANPNSRLCPVICFRNRREQHGRSGAHKKMLEKWRQHDPPLGVLLAALLAVKRLQRSASHLSAQLRRVFS